MVPALLQDEQEELSKWLLEQVTPPEKKKKKKTAAKKKAKAKPAAKKKAKAKKEDQAGHCRGVCRGEESTCIEEQLQTSKDFCCLPQGQSRCDQGRLVAQFSEGEGQISFETDGCRHRQWPCEGRVRKRSSSLLLDL